MPISCTEPPPPEPPPPVNSSREWPEGTCLAFGEVPIALEQLDRIADWVALIHTGQVRSAHRRTALTAILINQAAILNGFGEAHDTALAEASGQSMAFSQTASGNWRDLGLLLWGNAREQELDVWSDPIEGVGKILRIRVTEQRPAALPAADQFTVEVIEYPFVPPGFDVPALDELLTVTPIHPVDPAIADLIPAAWRYRMQPADKP